MSSILTKLAKYLPGPLFIAAGILLINTYLIPSILFIVAGLIACWNSYAYYREQKKKIDEN